MAELGGGEGDEPASSMDSSASSKPRSEPISDRMLSESDMRSVRGREGEGERGDSEDEIGERRRLWRARLRCGEWCWWWRRLEAVLEGKSRCRSGGGGRRGVLLLSGTSFALRDEFRGDFFLF